MPEQQTPLWFEVFVVFVSAFILGATFGFLRIPLYITLIVCFLWGALPPSKQLAKFLWSHLEK